MNLTLKQLKPLACHTRAHCLTCRTDADWRERVTGVAEFDCPHGVTEANIPSRGLGDTIEQSVAANHWGTGPARGVGDVFHDLVSAKYGLPACQRCKEIITEMNLLGVEGCKKTKAAILDGLWERKDQLKGWRGVIAKLPGTEALAKRELGKLFDAAVANNDPTATM